MTMDRCHAFLRQFVSTAAIAIAVSWAAAIPTVAPALAQDVGASQADLIRGLLPTVVNISVRKDEPPGPVAAATDAGAGPGPGAGTAIPLPDAGSNIKN